MKNKPKLIVVDIESTGLNPRQDAIHGIGILSQEDKGAYFPMWEIPTFLRELLADPEVTKVGHNFRFDIKFLLNKGFEINGPWYCTRVLAHALDENDSTSLENLSIKYLNESPDSSWKNDYKNFIRESGVSNIAQLHAKDLADPAHPYLSKITEYCIEDCNKTFKLWHLLRERLKNSDKLMKENLGCKKGLVDFYLNEAMPTERVLLEMEMRGIRINNARINSVQKEFSKRRDTLLSTLSESCAERIASIETGLFNAVLASKVTAKAKQKVKPKDRKSKTLFNWDSKDHVGSLIFSSFKVPEDLTLRTKSGTYSTSAGYLRELSKQLSIPAELKILLGTYLDYQKVKKIASTYTGDSKKGIISKMEDGNIYTEYSQFLNTWRLSSSKPNMQNLPRSSPVKSFFRTHSDTAVIFHVDASQIELRIAAHLSQDPKMLEIFNEGLCPHRMLAAKVYGVSYDEIGKEDERRQVGKTCNFLLIYKGSWFRLQEELKKNGIIRSEAECKAIQAAFFDMYKVYKQYLIDQLKFMHTYHRVVCESGAVRRVPEIVFGNYVSYYPVRSFTGPQQLKDQALDYFYDKKGDLDLRISEDEKIFTGASLLYSHATKQGYNFPVQHLAAHVMKCALKQLTDAGFKILNTVHDSADIELEIMSAKQDMPRIMNILENCYPLTVPLKWDSKLLTSFDEKDRAEITSTGELLVKRPT